MAGGKTRAFFSYSRRDRERVALIAEHLEQYDVDVLLDTEDILPTEEWRDRLRGLIGGADTIIFALSPNSLSSEVCDWEIAFAEFVE